MAQAFDISNLHYLSNRIHSLNLKYLRSTTLGCKDIRNRKFKFVTKTQILSIHILFNNDLEKKKNKFQLQRIMNLRPNKKTSLQFFEIIKLNNFQTRISWAYHFGAHDYSFQIFGAFNESYFGDLI